MPDYGNPSYWDERYSARSNESFDWYQSYSRIKPFIKTLLSTNGDFEVLINLHPEVQTQIVIKTIAQEEFK